jgi:hypothetical protein
MGARERPAAIAAAFTVAAGVLSAWTSWRTWIVPFVDSSREMNVPVRLLAGERLYRDVAYYYGPAGPWLEAIGIALGGRRFAALEAVGLLAAVLLLGSLAVLAGRAGSRSRIGRLLRVFRSPIARSLIDHPIIRSPDFSSITSAVQVDWRVPARQLVPLRFPVQADPRFASRLPARGPGSRSRPGDGS